MRQLIVTSLLCLVAACEPSTEKEKLSKEAGPAADAGTLDGSLRDPADAALDGGPGVSRGWLALRETKASDGSAGRVFVVPVSDGMLGNAIEIVQGKASEFVEFQLVPEAASLVYLVQPLGGAGSASVVTLDRESVGEPRVLAPSGIASLSDGGGQMVRGSRIALIGADSMPERRWVDIYDLADAESDAVHIEDATRVRLRGQASGFSPTGKSFVFGIERRGFATFDPLRLGELRDGKVVEERAAWAGETDLYVFTNGVTSFAQDLTESPSTPLVLVDEDQGPFAANAQAVAVAVNSAPPSLSLFATAALTQRTTLAAPFETTKAITWLAWLGDRRALFVQTTNAAGETHGWLLRLSDDNSLRDALDLGVIAPESQAHSPQLLASSEDGLWSAYLDDTFALHAVNAETALKTRVSDPGLTVSNAWITSDGRRMFYASGPAGKESTRLWAVALGAEKLSPSEAIALGASQTVEGLQVSAGDEYACVLTEGQAFFLDLRGEGVPDALPIGAAPESGRVVFDAQWTF